MPDPSPAETLKLLDYYGLVAKGFRQRDGESVLVRAKDLETLLAIARRAIRVEAVVQKQIDWQEDTGECFDCGFEKHIEQYEWVLDHRHDEFCPLVTAGLITRDGKRTEQK